MVPPWMLLVLAVVTEVIGTLAMNASGDMRVWWMYLIMYVFICSSYGILSFALRTIPVGIAIAIWEGLGVLLISGISYLFLGETLSMEKFLGLLLAVCGIILLNFGEVKEG
jgi:spermidine export protein MdtJ